MIRNSVKTCALCSTALVALAFGSAAYAQGEADELVITGSRVITNGFAAPTPVTVVTQEQMQMTAPNSLSDAVNQLPQFRASIIQAGQSGPTHAQGADGSFLNLRGLGAKRNLTLLDGQRVVQTLASGSVAGAVDLNVLPQSLVQRVDVTTGGGSAAYGADALSGVINFVLDSRFTGLKGEVRANMSTYGDNENVNLSVAFGRPLLGGRAHVIGSAEYHKSAGVPSWRAREWTYSNTAVIASGCPVPQTSLACPTQIMADNVVVRNMSSGGLITGGALALRDQYFRGATAVLTPFPLGTYVTASTMSGGGTDPDTTKDFVVLPPSQRANAFLRFGYDLTPDWNVAASLLYGASWNRFNGTVSQTAQGLTIFDDNPYLPASVRSMMISPNPGATSTALYNPATGLFNGPTRNTITLGRLNLDWGPNLEYNRNYMLRGSLSLDGRFDMFGKSWNLSAYYTRGEAWHKAGSTNTAIFTHIYEAVDAVASPGGPGLPAAGTPICRSTITNPTNGCAPLNVIGQGTASPAALRYITGGTAVNGDTTLTQKMEQDAMELNLRGEPFSTWAGPVSLGTGVAYRKELVDAIADPLSEGYNPALPGSAGFRAGVTAPLTINGFPAALRGARGRFTVINAGGFKGSLNVKEVYGETLIPLAKDMFLARQLDLNAAVRYADYQYGGGQTNWKVGISYRPIDDLRIRVAQSHDIRAPNLADLFGGIVQVNPAITDPFRRGTTGVPESNSAASTLSSGNPALGPEIGDTFTMGVVYRPTWNRWVDGLSVSVDYYNIIITDAIGNVAALNQCFMGNTQFCSFITRSTDPATFGAGNTIGPIGQVYNQPVNVGTAKQSGIDLEVSYRLPLSKLWEGRDDVFTVRALFSYMGKNCTYTLGGTSTSCQTGINAGSLAPGSGSNVDWQGTINFNYQRGPLTVNVQERFVNKGRLAANVDEAGNPLSATSFINPNTNQSGRVPNTVPAYWYTTLALTYKFGESQRYEGFLTVSNLFNTKPPKETGGFFIYGITPANSGLYDILGRQFTGGMRFRF